MPDEKDKSKIKQSSNSNELQSSDRLSGRGRSPLPAYVAQAKAAEQQPSPVTKKTMEGVLAGIGSRPPETVQSSTNPNDTFVGRFLGVLGTVFLTGSPTISVTIATKSENPNWYVVCAVVVGCWLVGGFLIAAGLRWPNWKPNHEVLARRLGAASNSIWVWTILLLLIAAGPAIGVGLLTSGSAHTQSQLDAALQAKGALQSKLDEVSKLTDDALSEVRSLKRELSQPQIPSSQPQTHAQANSTTLVPQSLEDPILREEVRKFVVSNIDEIRDSIYRLDQALTTTNSQLNGEFAEPLNHLFQQLMGFTIQRAIEDLDRAAKDNTNSKELVRLLNGFIGQYGTWQNNAIAFYKLAGMPSNQYIEEMLAGLRKADERGFGKLRDLKAIMPADMSNLDEGNLASRNGFFLQWQKAK